MQKTLLKLCARQSLQAVCSVGTEIISIKQTHYNVSFILILSM